MESAKRFIWRSLRPFSFWLSIVLVTTFLWAIDLNLRPFLLKQLVNQLAKQHNSLAPILWSAGYVFGVGLLMNAPFRLYEIAWLKVGPPLKRHIGALLMDKVMRQSTALFQGELSGSIGNRIKEITEHTSDLVQLVINEGICHIMAIGIAIALFWTVGPLFPLLLSVWVILFMGISFILVKNAQHLSELTAKERSTVMGRIVDVINNMMSVRLFTNRRHEARVIRLSLDTYVETDQKRHWYLVWVYCFQSLSFCLYEGLCLIYLIAGFRRGTISVGDFVLVLQINGEIMRLLWQFSRHYGQFVDMYGSITQGLKLILSPIAVHDAPKATVLRGVKGDIVFDNIFFSYPSGPSVFEGLSLHVRQGERLGIVGYSGAGKSTLLSLLLRLFDVDQGSISIDGTDIASVTQESLHAAIGMIPQDLNLFDRTLMDNIRYGLHSATDKEVYKAAKAADADTFIRALPEGYNSLVGERGIKLSGGQRQRIAIARVILKNAPILLLDEASSQLDALTERSIQKSLWTLMEGKTALIIAHRLTTLLHVDRIIVLDKGAIVEEGTHETLLKKKGLYKTLWDNQIGNLLGAG